jgi:hypothetical protein
MFYDIELTFVGTRHAPQYLAQISDFSRKQAFENEEIAEFAANYGCCQLLGRKLPHYL